MSSLSEAEFARLCAGIREDRDAILKHNPIGTPSETLLWMLLSVLISYLSLGDKEIPCFTGTPDEATYRAAILYVVAQKSPESFDPEPYIERLLSE